MSSLLPASLGVAAAIAVNLVHTNIAAAETSPPKVHTNIASAETTPSKSPNMEAKAVADPLDPAPRVGEHELKTAAMTKICDVKCQVVNFTENTIPDLGASQLVYTLLYPGKVGLSIPRRDGTVAVTITVMPTKLARGKAVVAMGTF